MVSDDTMARVSLVVFTLQNAAFVLLMRLSKVRDTHYNSSVAVLVTEALKLPLSILLLSYEKGGPIAATRQLWNDIALQLMDTLKISIPALLYTVQNNALFVAAENLEAAVFQVTYQLKTLTTAVLVVLVLGRQQAQHQWFALLLLTAGTILVHEPKKSSAARSETSESTAAFTLGIAATLTACLCSSVASVYLEKILVESKPSIWVRNVQLCLFTIPIAWMSTYFVEDAYMKEDGTPLHGFNAVVWAAIFTNAVGGMIVATVMKYAGNILRNFAQALAIIVGGFGSWLLFDFKITLKFVGGVACVICSIFIYGSKAEQLGQWKNNLLHSVGLTSTHTSYAMLPLDGSATQLEADSEDGSQRDSKAVSPAPSSDKTLSPTKKQHV
ncbi:hypothetical protein AB1Y20_016865 [Prymnesium parvum]|uniref:UDP-galactose transporter n=1 Tax=Prymnesium parvum TaxID=97485 RepID=A0AB34IDA1_PRYPA